LRDADSFKEERRKLLTDLNQPTTITDKLDSFTSDFKSAFTWCCAVFEIHTEKLIHMTQSATQIALTSASLRLRCHWQPHSGLI